MSRIVINNKAEVTDLQAIELAKQVIEGGRISYDNTSYCACTEVQLNSKTYHVYAEKNFKEDKLTIVKT